MAIGKWLLVMGRRGAYTTRLQHVGEADFEGGGIFGREAGEAVEELAAEVLVELDCGGEVGAVGAGDDYE